MTKQHILSEIRRTASANGGVPLGIRTFERETGIRQADWFGTYWKSWGDAVREAGFQPNTLTPRISEDELLKRYALLTRELGRAPVKGDIRLKKRQDPSFPSDVALVRRFGSYAELRSRAHAYCSRVGGLDDVRDVLSSFATPTEKQPSSTSPEVPLGFVYLIKSGRHYKIGKTNSVGRRERELAIQLPEKARRVHAIKTDDPDGIEAYWHKRFDSKRAHGEWFKLEAADVAAFKRRKFQ